MPKTSATRDDPEVGSVPSLPNTVRRFVQQAVEEMAPEIARRQMINEREIIVDEVLRRIGDVRQEVRYFGGNVTIPTLLSENITFTQSGNATGLTSSTVQEKLRNGIPLDPKSDFGCAWDGVTDDKTKFQNFVNAVCTATGGSGIFPDGTCALSDAVQIPASAGWRLVGKSKLGTNFLQLTDNKPIFKFVGGSTHNFELSRFQAKWTNNQASTNTAAAAIYFAGNASTVYNYYNFKMHDINTVNGCDFIGGDTTTKWSMWGFDLDGINIGGLVTRSVWTVSPSSSIGMPNGHVGHIYIDATSMVGPMFTATSQSNCRLDNVEINNANQGPAVLSDGGGGSYKFGAFRIETGTYASGMPSAGLFYFANGSLSIDKFELATISVTQAAAGYLFSTSGGTTVGSLHIDRIKLSGITVSGAENLYFFNTTPASCIVEVGSILNGISGMPSKTYWTNIAASAAANSLRIRDWLSGNVSTDKGDADYQIVLGDPNVIVYKTTLTADRTVTLPSITVPNNNFSGLSYTISRRAQGNFSLYLKDSAGTVIGVFPPQSTGNIEAAWDRAVATGEFKKLYRSYDANIQLGVTAHAGGGQASATQLTGQLVTVTTVASNHDSVLLPPAVGSGISVSISNVGASILDIYPASGEAINGETLNSPISPAAKSGVTLHDVDSGRWLAIPTA